MIIAEHAPMSMATFCSIVRSNNTSGEPGVYYQLNRTGRKQGGKPHAVWEARIPLANGKVRTRIFSVAKYGYEQGKELAIAARRKGLAELERTAFREKQQPQPSSSAEDIMRLRDYLSGPEQRRQRKEADRLARAQLKTARDAQRLAKAQAIEQQKLQNTSMTGEPYISRWDYQSESGGGWRVCIQRQGKRMRQSFSDTKYGGKTAALEAAKSWRDALFLSLPVVSKAEVAERLNSTNRSGVSGVTWRPDKHSGAWVANAPKRVGQSMRTRVFSIKKYGQEQAYALAVAARAAFVAEIADLSYAPNPSSKQMIKKLGDRRSSGDPSSAGILFLPDS